METKICVICNAQKSIDNLYNKYSNYKQCNFKRRLKRYYENKNKKSNQQLLL